MLEKLLNNLIETREHIISADNNIEAAKIAAKLLIQRTKAQATSIYLFCKDGNLKRIALSGLDKNGLPLGDDWLPNEILSEPSYSKDKDSASISFHGKPHMLQVKDSSIALGLNKYIEKIGEIHNVLHLPLNGKHRTFGVVRVYNTKKPSKDDVYWYSAISSNLASIISQIRRQNELKILNDYSRTLMKVFNKDEEEVIFKNIAERIIGEETYYKVCIIRVCDDKDCLTIKALAGVDIDWRERNNDPLPKGQRIAGRVYEMGKAEFIEDIEKEQAYFGNIDWIRKNKLKSFACFPLRLEQEIYGTVSLFTAFKYKFYERDKKFLENIAFLAAAYLKNIDTMREIERSQEEMDQILRDGREVSYDNVTQKIIHSHKHDLIDIKSVLEKGIERSSIPRGLIEKQITDIQKKINSINEQFDKTRSEPVNINYLTQDIIKLHKMSLKRNKIEIELDLFSELPTLFLNSKDIKEILFNLLTNAIKAVLAKNNKDKKIFIRTQAIVVSDISYVQIEVEDNGIGIKNEIAERVYEKNFTTFDNGTGMGLHITQNIVESYGGRIFANSTVGKGANFIVQIPIERYKI